MMDANHHHDHHHHGHHFQHHYHHSRPFTAVKSTDPLVGIIFGVHFDNAGQLARDSITPAGGEDIVQINGDLDFKSNPHHIGNYNIAFIVTSTNNVLQIDPTRGVEHRRLHPFGSHCDNPPSVDPDDKNFDPTAIVTPQVAIFGYHNAENFTKPDSGAVTHTEKEYYRVWVIDPSNPSRHGCIDPIISNGGGNQ
jgi:hypothetical protein